MPGFSYDLLHDWRREVQTFVTAQGSFLCSPVWPRVIGPGNIIVHKEVAYHVHEALPVEGMSDVYEAGVVVSMMGDETFARLLILFKPRDYVHRATHV